MKIESDRFCINRKIAPALSLEAFFRLVSELGIHKVELRNDMAGGQVTDNLTPQQVRQLAERYQIEILTINAIYPFNQLTPRVLKLTESLLQTARDSGARALVLCPLNDGTPVAEQETLAALHELAPLFARYGIDGLVEPLGFPQSSLRSALQTQALIRDARAPFSLLLDTFHHHLYPPAEQERDRLDIPAIGLVHISGVDDPRPREQLTDEERIMLTPQDRLHSCAQMRELEARGYRGVYSFEPFASQLAQWDAAQVADAIESSLSLIRQG